MWRSLPRSFTALCRQARGAAGLRFAFLRRAPLGTLAPHGALIAAPRLQGEIGDAFVEHLRALNAKLEWVASDESAKYSAAYR